VKTEAEAIEMPVIAANTALAATVATPSPPRRRANTRWATSKVSRPRFETDTRMPISTKSGTTPNRCSRIESLAAAPIIRAASSGLLSIQMPAKDTAISAMPMCMPK